MEKCTGFTRSGARCGKSVRDGSGRCHYHRTSNEAQLAEEIRDLRAMIERERDRFAEEREGGLLLTEREVVVLWRMLDPDGLHATVLADELGVTRKRVYEIVSKVRLRLSQHALRTSIVRRARAANAMTTDEYLEATT